MLVLLVYLDRCNLSVLKILQSIEKIVNNLQQTCREQAVVSQPAMRTHPDVSLLITSCLKMSTDLLELERFWWCGIFYKKFNPNW